MTVETYKNYKIRVDYGDCWNATIFPPGERRSHPVVVRVAGDEGEAKLIERVKLVIDQHIKDKTPPKRG
jgi:hypothetical protein